MFSIIGHMTADATERTLVTKRHGSELKAQGWTACNRTPTPAPTPAHFTFVI